MILKLLGLSIISGILYRLGGIGKPFDTKYRDLGCPLIACGALFLFWHPVLIKEWLLLLCSFGFMFGALTTYWDIIYKDSDNFWLHGFGVGIALLPLAWAGIHWWTILIRAIVLAITMGSWSKFIGWDDLEEFGRGFLIVASLPLLLI